MNIAVVTQRPELWNISYHAQSLDNGYKREIYKKPANSARLISYTFLYFLYTFTIHTCEYLLNIMYTLEESSSQSCGIYNTFIILYHSIN